MKKPSACAGVSGGELKLVLGYSDYVFCVLFTLEMVVRLAAFGPKKYAKSPWNLLDAFVVVISWLAVGLPAVEGLTALRALRAPGARSSDEFFFVCWSGTRPGGSLYRQTSR